jgi:hypothetical protein
MKGLDEWLPPLCGTETGLQTAQVYNETLLKSSVASVNR